MRPRLLFVTGAAVWAALLVGVGAQNPTPAKPASAAARPATTAPRPTTKTNDQGPTTNDENAVVRRYCVGCHNDKMKTGGLTLEHFDVAQTPANAEVAEAMIRKLQAGLMPPPGVPRPNGDAHAALVRSIETTIDAAAAAKPNPGGRVFQRLNRPEYERAIKDLLLLDVDAGDWLPLDQKSANFDNIADAQALSPTLIEAYLNAAAAISRMAVGDRQATNVDTTYTNAGFVSQHPWDHIDGTPFGTRGGMAVSHVFPADGEYVFEVTLQSGANARY